GGGVAPGGPRRRPAPRGRRRSRSRPPRARDHAQTARARGGARPTGDGARALRRPLLRGAEDDLSLRYARGRRRGRSGDRPGGAPQVRRDLRHRPRDQPDDRRRPDRGRARPGHRRRAPRGAGLRRPGPAAHDHVHGLPGADGHGDAGGDHREDSRGDAHAGKDMLEGLKLAFEQIGYQSAGRKIELIEEDDEGNPAVAQAKYRKLVTQDRVHVLTGVLLSNIGYGLIPPIERDQLPTLYLTTPDDLTKKHVSKWILRTNFAASQPMHPLADYAPRPLKYKKLAAIAMDNPFGHEQIGGFQRVFEDGGGRVTQKIWVPLNALDFAPYLTQVSRDVDAVCAVFVAAQGVRFIKQYTEYGLKGKLPLIGSGVMTDEHV